MSNGSAVPSAKLPGAIVLDIEGTVAAISFVTEVRQRMLATIRILAERTPRCSFVLSMG